MRFSRRDALRTAAAAALGASARHLPAQAVPEPPLGVEFEFTGLFAIQHWMRTSYKAGMLLLKGKAPHTPQLLIRIKDVQSTTLTDFQVIHVGGDAYYLWNLAGRLIWVDDVQTGSYDSDTQTDLKFGSQNDWEKLEHFAQIAKAIGKKNVHVKKPKKITAKILLTRGAAVGVKPELQQEIDRRYRICSDADQNFKRYTSQLRVVHPFVAGKETLTLRVAAIKTGKIDEPRVIGEKFRTIVLKALPGALTRVGVLNTASGAPGEMHFHEFFDVVGEDDEDLQSIPSENSPKPAKCEATHGAGPEAPYVGCIPPIYAQDAP